MRAGRTFRIYYSDKVEIVKRRRAGDRAGAPWGRPGAAYHLLVAAPPLTRSLLKRLAPGLPVGGLLLSAEVAVLAGRHVSKLDGAQRRRLLALVRQTRGRPGALAPAERLELLALLASLEPRLFLGSAVRSVSPVPLPKRLLYGPRRSAARKAAAAARRG